MNWAIIQCHSQPRVEKVDVSEVWITLLQFWVRAEKITSSCCQSPFVPGLWKIHDNPKSWIQWETGHPRYWFLQKLVALGWSGTGIEKIPISQGLALCYTSVELYQHRNRRYIAKNSTLGYWYLHAEHRSASVRVFHDVLLVFNMCFTFFYKCFIMFYGYFTMFNDV